MSTGQASPEAAAGVARQEVPQDARDRARELGWDDGLIEFALSRRYTLEEVWQALRANVSGQMAKEFLANAAMARADSSAHSELLTMLRPLVIGHAAAAGEAPANTLAGVRSCLGAGADAMEIDLQLCADGVPVLMHDSTVDRTTNLSGAVRDFTLAALASADAGDGEPVPSLEQVLDLVAGRLTVMCELKSAAGQIDLDSQLVEAVLHTIAGRNASEWVAIHSFNPAIVERSRALDSAVSAALISPPVRGHQVPQLFGQALTHNAQAISVEHTCVDRAFVMGAKRRQLTVWTWTPDRQEDWSRLVWAGVDGIITNQPHQLRAYLDNPPWKVSFG